MLQELAKLLNNMGRFKVSVVKSLDEKQIEAEKETVAVIQGEVISGGEVERGQFTDLATCTGGIGGRISSAAAATINEEAVTLDNWRGYVCRRGAFTSDVTELAISSAFATAGLGEAYHQKTRLYAYTNTKICPCSHSQISVLQSLALNGKHWQYVLIQQILAEALQKKVPIAILRKAI